MKTTKFEKLFFPDKKGKYLKGAVLNGPAKYFSCSSLSKPALFEMGEMWKSLKASKTPSLFLSTFKSGRPKTINAEVSSLGDVLLQVDSAIVHGPHRWSTHLQNMTRELGQQMNCIASTSVFICKKGGYVLPPHKDNHHIFIFQILGRRKWLVSKTFAHLESKKLKPSSSIKRFKLLPGSMLYIPPNTFHYGLAMDPLSVHITFSLTAPSKLDLAHEIFQAAWEKMSSDHFFSDSIFEISKSEKFGLELRKRILSSFDFEQIPVNKKNGIASDFAKDHDLSLLNSASLGAFFYGPAKSRLKLNSKSSKSKKG